MILRQAPLDSEEGGRGGPKQRKRKLPLCDLPVIRARLETARVRAGSTKPTSARDKANPLLFRFKPGKAAWYLGRPNPEVSRCALAEPRSPESGPALLERAFECVKRIISKKAQNIVDSCPKRLQIVAQLQPSQFEEWQRLTCFRLACPYGADPFRGDEDLFQRFWHPHPKSYVEDFAGSLVAEGFDRIKSRGLHSRPDAEDQPNRHRDRQAN